ncbi:hypothetical protein ACK1LH_21030 (plasmid) [Metabacillus indicus]|uniref:hypothetical protein n=1 Tax=Metabacillus indicus TaxID=246786 RepID=UPI003984086A
MKVNKILGLLVLTSSLFTGCIDKDVTANFTTSDIQKINLEISKREVLENEITYWLKLKNNSDFTIKQNNVFVSYPLILNNGSKGNVYKVEAQGNKLDIMPGEEVVLTVSTPFQGIGDKDSISFDTPQIQVEGYLDSVNEKSKFSFNKSEELNQ